MNPRANDYRSEEEGWSWTVAPAIPGADGRVWVKLLAFDGEYAVSYVYEHSSITTPGTLLYEVDVWLNDLWRAPSGRLFAAAESGEVHMYDSRRWHVVQTPEETMLSCVWGLDDEHIYAAGEGVILSLAGEKWTYVTSGHEVYIDRVCGLANNDLYAVGRRGLMLHFDGTAWRRLDVPTNLDLNSVYPVDLKTVCAVGAEGVILIGSRERWKAFQFGDVDFVDVAEYEGNIYIAATDKGVFRLEGDDLVPFRSDVRATSLTPGGGFLCIAGGLSVHRFDGSRWESYNYSVSAEA